MDFQTAFGEVVRNRRLANGQTLRSISDNGYLALGYLSEVERGQKCPSSQIIEAIAEGLRVSPSELIIEAGLLMSNVPDTPESLFARNSEWQRQYAPMR